MITLILFLFVICIVFVELVSLWSNKHQLQVEFDVDTTLVEPGEVVTLYYSIQNPSRLPFLFVGFSLYLEPEVSVCEDKEFCRLHVRNGETGSKIFHQFFLLGHRRFKGKVHVSLSRRGLQRLGRYFIETGDYLGIHPVFRSDLVSKRIICTSEKSRPVDFEFPGGELGDLSVRRFIIDDPTMLLGYREYTGREPMKQISWKQTAKIGKLMVRQNDFTTDRVAVVIVNMDPTRRQLMEECLKLIRTVCEQLEEARIPYELRSNGDLLSVPEGVGKEHLFFILRRLGLSRLTGFTSFSGLVDRCVRRRRSNCSYIVITPVLWPEIRAQIDYLGGHVESHPIVVCPDTIC